MCSKPDVLSRILQLKLLEGREEKLPTLSPEEISKIIDVVSMIRSPTRPRTATN